jgi:acyl-CoA reductase-like NAD-dependent aldehyde dehydrogenase
MFTGHSCVLCISNPAQNFINGNWTPALAGQTMPVYEPATGQAYAAIADSTAQDVDLAVRAARKAFR